MEKSFLNNPNYPRGFRNNNPGNLVYNSNNNWGGKISYANNLDYSGSPSNVVKHFEQFKELRWGLRALMKLIYNYHNQGFTNVTSIISKYAPSFENNTTAYIAHVADIVGVNPLLATISLTKERVIALCKAIVYVENGSAYEDYITDADYQDAYSILGITLESESSVLPKLLGLSVLGYGAYYIIKKRKENASRSNNKA